MEVNLSNENLIFFFLMGMYMNFLMIFGALLIVSATLNVIFLK